MGPTPILEMARAYGLRPRLWLLLLRVGTTNGLDLNFVVKPVSLHHTLNCQLLVELFVPLLKFVVRANKDCSQLGIILTLLFFFSFQGFHLYL